METASDWISGRLRFGQPAQDATGAELDERGEPQPGERLECLAPAHGGAELGGEEAGPIGRVVVHVRVDVGDHAHLGREEGHLGQSLAQVGPRPLHQRRVECARHRDRHHPLRAQSLGQLAGPGHCFGRAGDDDLTRRVVVRHPHVAFGAHAGGLGVVVRNAEQGGHRARGFLTGPGHGVAAGHDQTDAVLETEGAAGDQCGVLAEAVPGTGGRGEADALHCVEHDEAQHRRRQLRVLGLGQFLDRRTEQQPGQITVGGERRLFDHLPGRVVDPGFPHAGAL